MEIYELEWEEIQTWKSEVEADSKKEAIAKVYDDIVQDKAEVIRTYNIRKIKAYKVLTDKKVHDEVMTEIEDVKLTPSVKVTRIEGTYYTVSPHTCGTCGSKRVCAVMLKQDYQDIDTFHCKECYTGPLGMDYWKGKEVDLNED